MDKNKIASNKILAIKKKLAKLLTMNFKNKKKMIEINYPPIKI